MDVWIHQLFFKNTVDDIDKKQELYLLPTSSTLFQEFDDGFRNVVNFFWIL